MTVTFKQVSGAFCNGIRMFANKISILENEDIQAMMDDIVSRLGNVNGDQLDMVQLQIIAGFISKILCNIPQIIRQENDKLFVPHAAVSYLKLLDSVLLTPLLAYLSFVLSHDEEVMREDTVKRLNDYRKGINQFGASDRKGAPSYVLIVCMVKHLLQVGTMLFSSKSVPHVIYHKNLQDTIELLKGRGRRCVFGDMNYPGEMANFQGLLHLAGSASERVRLFSYHANHRDDKVVAISGHTSPVTVVVELQQMCASAN
jgi:hypothetical protein